MCVPKFPGIEDLILDDLDGLTQKGGKGDCDLFNHDDIVEVFFCL